MIDRKLSGAYVWLASASVAVVLVASGVAVSRIADRGDERASTATTGAPSVPAEAPAGPSVSGPGSGVPAEAGSGAAAAEQAAPASAPSAASGQGQKRAVTGKPAASSPPSAAGSAPANPSASSAASGSTGSKGSEAGGAQPGGAAGGAQDGGGSPPAPSQQPPEKQPLVAASVSAGEGAQGGVVGVGIGENSPDADVTLGTNQLVGNHPPSKGTGVMFGGRFLNPPPSVPVPPG